MQNHESNWDSELEVMAADPDIQRELHLIQTEYAITESDGLDIDYNYEKIGAALMSAFPSLEKSLTVPADPVWRLTVEQYHQMIQAGILTADDPVELLEGWLVTKMPKNRPHSLATQLTREALARVVPSGWYVDAQEPITTADSEPEPDISVVRGSRRDYTDRHPNPDEVAMLVEVSDATLSRDRTLKLRVYAGARIALYWILNLPEQQLEIYSDPAEVDEQAHYQHRNVYHGDDEVPVVINGQEIARLSVRELLS